MKESNLSEINEQKSVSKTEKEKGLILKMRREREREREREKGPDRRRISSKSES